MEYYERQGVNGESLNLRVRRLLRESPLIDGHNDMPWRYLRDYDNNLDALDFSKDTSKACPKMLSDIPRLRAGCVGGCFWAVFIPDDWANGGKAYRAALRQIQFVKDAAARYSDDFEMAYSAGDIRRIHASGKIASLIGMEGAHTLEGRPERIEEFYNLGARYLTLGCADSNAFADAAAGTPRHGGLSPLGKEAIRIMNRIGMMIDLSHTSYETMRDALDLTDAPIIFSHSNARALCDSPRNVPDDILTRTAQCGGIIMATFVPMFLSAERNKNPDAPTPPLSAVADHIDYICEKAGVNYAGIGSDFGGFIPPPPIGLPDASAFPALFEELARRGYSDEDLKKIAGENILRVMDAVSR
ncbi:MAG TPA: dipeptidase [Candidatus Sumerlaeota bacterium]|nr:MAG: Membrane dipeptidase (Peptidase family M19) [candidate division BRC1 bacterium ADurb.Bin183]HOE63367.1 dipeptidase [Candidatus Sumerlaeota bacterium]HRR31793.1 dipeptidase [Candidatus Sumerlaeia bacterium]HON50678.1 dipeptidase [Candidatus Sumerlaeota bacterium]HOR65204.1 dipeptidase [Candidatus Sumerlaeota bacterium]